MKHKTAELTGPLLDAAVAMANGWPRHHEFPALGWSVNGILMPVEEWQPSTNWGDGGPIIDQHDIHVGGYGTCRSGEIRDDSRPWVTMWGETALIAAMRAYVAFKLGDEVGLP